MYLAFEWFQLDDRTGRTKSCLSNSQNYSRSVVHSVWVEQCTGIICELFSLGCCFSWIWGVCAIHASIPSAQRMSWSQASLLRSETSPPGHLEMQGLSNDYVLLLYFVSAEVSNPSTLTGCWTFFCYFSDKDLWCSSTVWHLHACREWTDCWVKYVCSCSKTDLRSEEDVLCNCTLLSGQEIFIYLFPRSATPDFNGVRT